MDEDKKGVKVFLELNQPNVKFIKALDEVSSKHKILLNIPKTVSPICDLSSIH
jgi:hypothetical protein